MATFVLIIVIICAVLLIAAVLVQPGKADMISGMGGFGGQMSNLFGVRQSRNFLQNITIGLAVAIMLLSIVINKGFFGSMTASTAGNGSILNQGLTAPVAPKQVAPQQPQVVRPENIQVQQNQNDANKK